MKVCSKCDIEKEEFEFSQENNLCNGCFKEQVEIIKKRRSEYYKKNKEELNKKKKIYYQNNREKFLSLSKECYERNKEEKKAYGRQYHKKNREKILKQKKEYQKNNKEVLYKRKKEYRKKNKDYIRNHKREYERQRRKTDVCFRIRKIVSMRVSNALKISGSCKNSSVLKHLPYTIEELKTHLESQFESWMSWENHGPYDKYEKRWHIDHIIPQYLLPYDSMDHPNFLKCWALENLRPLEAIENLRRGKFG
jgi:hypothetical protein